MIKYSDLVDEAIESIEIKAGRKFPTPKPITKKQAVDFYTLRRAKQ